MVLVDTSVWINYFRQGDPDLERLLDAYDVAIHDFITGELACGNFKKRSQIFNFLQLLPKVDQASHTEVINYIESNQLMGKGLSYVDIHLAVSAKISGINIWTTDKRFDEVNKKLGISY